MNEFRCVAVPTETAEQFRSGDGDDAGNPLRRVERG
jgi:hypothetical protein